MKRSIFSRTASALAALAVLVGAADVYAAELIQNGGFESPYLGPTVGRVQVLPHPTPGPTITSSTPTPRSTGGPIMTRG